MPQRLPSKQTSLILRQIVISQRLPQRTMSTPFQSQFPAFRQPSSKAQTQVNATPPPPRMRKRGAEAMKSERQEMRSFSDFGIPRGTFTGSASYVPETIILSDSDDTESLRIVRPRRTRFTGNKIRAAKPPSYSTSAETTRSIREEIRGRSASERRRLDPAGGGTAHEGDAVLIVGEGSASDGRRTSREESTVTVEPRRFSVFGTLMEALPRHNTFLKGVDPDNIDDNAIEVQQVDDIVTRDAPQLVTARESGFFDTTVETGHEDMAVRVASGAVYFR